MRVHELSNYIPRERTAIRLLGLLIVRIVRMDIFGWNVLKTAWLERPSTEASWSRRCWAMMVGALVT